MIQKQYVALQDPKVYEHTKYGIPTLISGAELKVSECYLHRKPHWPFCDYDVENKCGLLNRLVTVTIHSYEKV